LEQLRKWSLSDAWKEKMSSLAFCIRILRMLQFKELNSSIRPGKLASHAQLQPLHLAQAEARTRGDQADLWSHLILRGSRQTLYGTSSAYSSTEDRQKGHFQAELVNLFATASEHFQVWITILIGAIQSASRFVVLLQPTL
jgi:hypothetical protein